MLDMWTFVTAALLLAAIVWFASTAEQLVSSILRLRRQVAVLGGEQRRAARELLRHVSELKRYENEIEENRKAISEIVQQTAQRRQALEAFVPPPPLAIYASAEFPASKRDQAWVISFAKPEAIKARVSISTPERLCMVWASDHALAIARAQQLPGQRGLEAFGGHRLR